MDIRIQEEYLQQAMELHKKYSVVDAHLDLAGEILLRNQGGEKDVVRRYYLPHFQTAGINLIVSSIYVENQNLEHGWENALAQIKALKNDIQNLEGVRPVLNREDLEWAKRKGNIGILIYMEGLDPIGEDADKLDELYRMGVRGAALTWSRENKLATGCCKAVQHIQKPGKITQAGEQIIKRMEELSMFLDVSHLNDEGYEQLFSIAKRPFIATHSGSRSVFENYRNMTDAQMEKLAQQGGIMGVNGCKYIAGSLSGNHLEMLCRHLEYEVSKIGAEHVGYGFDLCDSYTRARALWKGLPEEEREDCLQDHSQVPLVTAALLQRGMKKEDVIRIIGSNFMDYFCSFL